MDSGFRRNDEVGGPFSRSGLPYHRCHLPQLVDSGLVRSPPISHAGHTAIQRTGTVAKFRPRRISMIAAEIEGSAHRRRTVGYVEDVRPRDTGGWREIHPAGWAGGPNGRIKRKALQSFPWRAFLLIYSRQRPTFPQSDPCSIIGARGLNYRVRDGNGCDPSAMAAGKART